MDWFYSSRDERSKWLSERFKQEISESTSVLDVGCFNADFKQNIPKSVRYCGIDIAGKPDIFLNLDEIDALPFEDESFDFIVCADVLEHLDKIHFILDELFRVSNKYVLITLPNAFAGLHKFLRRKSYTNNKEKLLQFGRHLKFYGLPLEKPTDRHRWFFSFEEAVDFLKYRSQKANYKINLIESEAMHEKRKLIEQIYYFALSKINKNLVNTSCICLMERVNNGKH